MKLRVLGPVIGAIVALVLGLVVGRSGEAARRPGVCPGEMFLAGEPLYAGGTAGYPTPEEAARVGVGMVVSEDLWNSATAEEWRQIPLDLVSSGPGSVTFSGNVRDVVPDADRDEFTVTVSQTEAGGYRFTGGSVCLIGG